MIQGVADVPQKPGVYIFKGTKEKIIYVGKAKNLRNRLASYFRSSAKLDPRKAKMVRMVRDFSCIVTGNELEALILEASLIKQHKPRFNIILRDDKNYPYIKLTVMEDWPRIEVVRRVRKDGNIYFGPYVPAQAMWEAIATMRKNFQIRTCRYPLDRPARPCIQYQMKRCPAPCAGLANKEEYMRAVEDVRLFLLGEKKALMKRLEEEMQGLADEMRFEDAARVRDSIAMLRRAFESQKVIAPELGDIDIIGHYFEAIYAEGKERTQQLSKNGPDWITAERVSGTINVLFIRNGVLIGAKNFFLEDVTASGVPEIIHSFVGLFYARDIVPPPLILTATTPENSNALLTWLQSRRGGAVKIRVPERGKKHELLEMANENARIHFNAKKDASPNDILNEIKEKLHLAETPGSIGAFDASTIQGSESSGAFIYWENDGFNKDMYRHLKIREVQGVDDYAMMREIVERVFSFKGQESGVVVPDLVIIDGGSGQLEAALQVLKKCGIETATIGIAKKPDRAILPDGEVIELEDRSRASLLLKRIRDEAHRFVISFHRKLRDKRTMESLLEKINGIGKKRRLDLLRHFGSIDRIRKASAEEIMKVRGFDRKTAERLINGLIEH